MQMTSTRDICAVASSTEGNCNIIFPDCKCTDVVAERDLIYITTCANASSWRLSTQQAPELWPALQAHPEEGISAQVVVARQHLHITLPVVRVLSCTAFLQADSCCEHHQIADTAWVHMYCVDARRSMAVMT